LDPDAASGETIFNIGLMYRFDQPEGGPVRLGLVVSDVTNQTKETITVASMSKTVGGAEVALGVGWPVTDTLLLAVDVTDITNRTDSGPFVSAGVEFKAGEANQWRLRAGLVDTGDGHDLTLGAGYLWKNWRADFGWEETDPGHLWTVGGGVHF
jgi:hypothetical protein